MLITPNRLTLARIVVVPVIALLICMKTAPTSALALVLFVLAAASDWYDGYLARQTGTSSLFGRVFDANADKLLIICCLLALAFSDKLNMGLIFPALAIICREIFVSGLREYVSLNTPQQDDESEEEKAGRGLASSDLAKIKTAAQMVAIAFLIPPSEFMDPYLGMIGGLCLWASAALGIYTAWQYWKIVKFTPVIKSL